MKGGFTFCGTDIADLKLEYAPELTDTYVYRSAERKVYEETYDGHTGGHFYGVSREPKEFILRCIFEEKTIDKGFLTRVESFFRVGKSGQLVFKRRPWCYYYATVTGYDDHEITNYMNGYVKITMKAYYPFARCDQFYSFLTDEYHENIMQNSALYDTEGIAPPNSFTNLTETTSLLLGNPGTERAKVAVIAAGDAGMGILITNKTTNQTMKLVAMSRTVTTFANRELVVDGISGKTILRYTDGSEPVIAFLYHDYGYIELDPGYPATRKVFIQATGGSNELYVTNILREDYSGKHIYACGNWHKIVSNGEHTIELEDALEESGNETTTIMTMNEIEVRPVSEMYLSRLTFSFKPTFA